MDEAFTRVVEDGLKLTKCLVLPNGGWLPLPRPHLDPAVVLLQLMPAAPMAYAVVVDPGVVDSPNMPSYQPHVYAASTRPRSSRSRCVRSSSASTTPSPTAPPLRSPCARIGGCTTSRAATPATTHRCAHRSVDLV